MTRLTSICVYCGSGPGADPAYKAAAEILGRSMAEQNIRLVYGGGSVGLMGITASAVLANGGKVNEINDKFRVALETYIAKQLEGHPDLIEKLTPKYAPMARRQVADNQWYKTLLEPHVEPAFGEVVRITSTGVVTADGQGRRTLRRVD